MEPQQQTNLYDEDGDKILGSRPLTILEKEEAQAAKQLHRLNMVKKQFGFKGERAFISKPAEINFPDFTVGKIHTLVISLTNVSNAFNSFNVLPLPDKIRNYFEVEYVPKGKISPGITCEIKFKFFPQLDEDIFSEFSILAETGKISFPIKCTSQKTIVRCDQPQIVFKDIIYGQSGFAKLTIKNIGYLPSLITFQQHDGSELSKDGKENTLLAGLTFERAMQIKGNCDKVINFEFKPNQIGIFNAQLLLYVHNILHSPPLLISLFAECVEVPVKIENELYDFHICLLGHIYRQRLSFFNQGETPMSFKMVQNCQSKKYFEFNPAIGYIQKQTKIDVWVKFSAEKDLLVYLNKFSIEKDTFVIPFHMSVTEQVKPVTFELKFKITSEKVTIRPMELNFGTIFEGLSSKIELQLQNESDLPQEILFYPLKPQISLKHGQHHFKLLPKQSIKTYIIYNSKKLQENGKPMKEEGNITCKIITGEIATGQLKLDYAVQVIRPDLCISSNKIELPALQIGEITHASTMLKNNTNKEIIFELFLPAFEVCGLKITPVVKTLSPKQEVELNIQYHSFIKKITPELIRKITQSTTLKPTAAIEEKQMVMKEVAGKKEAKKEVKLTKQQQEQIELERKKLEEEQRIQQEKEEKERMEQERNFDSVGELTKMGGEFYEFDTTQHYKWLLPVYSKQKNFPDASAEINYIQVTTTSIQQVIQCDKKQINFGQIAVGTRTVKQLLISSKGDLSRLKVKNLPIFCSFNILNSLKEVAEGKPFRAIVEFQPIEEQQFEQKLEFYTEKYTVSCLLKGKGVRPEVSIEPSNGLVNLGGVLIDESSERVFKIKNVCNFQIRFELQKVGVGMLNSNSSRAMSYIPSYGVIQANGVIEIKMKFKPDRVGQKYYEKIKIHVEEQKQVHHFYISGACFPRQAYVSDFKDSVMPTDANVTCKVELPFDWLKIKDENSIYGPNNKTILLEFTKGRETQRCFKRKIVIGSCRLLDSKAEKPTNFQIVMPKDDKFQCDNLKGTVASGLEQVVTFTFKPEQTDPFIAKIPVLAGVGQWREVKAELKLSGGFVKAGGVDAVSFEIVLKVYVNQL